MTTYQKFRELFEKFDLKYRGYSLNTPISRSLYDVVAKPRKGFYRSSLRSLFRKFDVKSLCEHRDSDTFLFYQGVGDRRDENQWCDFINEEIIDCSKVFYSKDIENASSFHPVTILSMFFKVLKSLKSTELTLWQKLDIFAHIMPYCNTIDDLESIEFSWVKKFVAMLYPLSLGSVLTQYFNKKGVETIALADGIYFDYGEDAPYDAVNYSDFISDKLLFWGDYSKREYEHIGITPNRLFVGGYPKPDVQQDMKNPNSFKKCCVLLARTPYDEANMELLEVLGQFTTEYQFFLKLHPSNKVATYQQIADKYGFEIVDKSLTMDECIGKDVFDFAIAVNTTAYYEALIKGLPCLRYRNARFLMMAGYEDDFNTPQDFKDRLESIKAMLVADYQTAIATMLKDAIGFGINNYRELIVS